MDDLIRKLELLVAEASIEDVIISLSDVCFAKAELYDCEDESKEVVQYWNMLAKKLSNIVTIKE